MYVTSMTMNKNYETGARYIIKLETNTLAYFAGASVTMNKRFIISAQDRTTD